VGPFQASLACLVAENLAGPPPLFPGPRPRPWATPPRRVGTGTLEVYFRACSPLEVTPGPAEGCLVCPPPGLTSREWPVPQASHGRRSGPDPQAPFPPGHPPRGNPPRSAPAEITAFFPRALEWAFARRRPSHAVNPSKTPPSTPPGENQSPIWPALSEGQKRNGPFFGRTQARGGAAPVQVSWRWPPHIRPRVRKKPPLPLGERRKAHKKTDEGFCPVNDCAFCEQPTTKGGISDRPQTKTGRWVRQNGKIPEMV